MNTPLKIFCDSPLGEKAFQLLKEELAPHELLLPSTPTTSVLASASYTLEGIDIVLGQPDAKAVLDTPGIKWVQTTSAGYTRYDTPEFREAAKKKPLILTNSSHVYDEPCAEHVLAFMLAHGRQFPIALNTLPSSGTPQWNQLRHGCRLLYGQSVLILGYGAIAERLVEMLAPFHVNVTAYRRKARGNEKVKIVGISELPQALAHADHVVNILPDNAESRNFCDAQRFSEMKQGALFYNIGRGTTVDQDALVSALKGHLGAAWLDVTEPEPLPEGHALRHLKNCFITPHTAGGHDEEFLRLAKHFVKNFRLYLEKKPLDNRVI